MAERRGFVNARGHGFSMTFDNGWTVSVMWGPGNYCSNRNEPEPAFGTLYPSGTAEVAWWKGDAPVEDRPAGWLLPDQVLAKMQEIAARVD